MSNKATILPDLNGKDRKKLRYYSYEMFNGKWPLDNHLIEKYIQKKLDTINSEKISVKQVLGGNISHEDMIRLNSVLKPRDLRSLQFKRINEFLNILDEIRWYVPMFVSNGTVLAEYGWYGYCKKMCKRLRKGLEKIYNSKRTNLNKVRDVNSLVEKFYKEKSIDKKIVNEVSYELSLFEMRQEENKEKY